MARSAAKVKAPFAAKNYMTSLEWTNTDDEYKQDDFENLITASADAFTYNDKFG